MLLKDTNGQRITYRQIVVNELIRRDGALCNICKQPLGAIEDTETDHIVPLRMNGSNDLTNLQLTHKSCHRKKDRELMRIHNINPAAKKTIVNRKISPWKLDARKKIRKEIDHHIKNGKSIVSIAKMLKMSRPTIYDFLARADLE